MIIKYNLDKKSKIFLIIITLFVIFSLIALNTYANETDEVYLVSIKGTIDLGLSSYVQRALEEAVSNKAKAVILEIDTFGGRVDAAVQIRDQIINLNIPSVAYIKNRAWSAGALIALSAKYILMDKSASIGAAEPQPADEKTISALRAEFTSTALSRGRSEDIAAAMVDKDVEIKGIIEKDKILTLNAEQAIKLNIADNIVLNNEEVLNFLNLRDAKIVHIYPNWAENISRFVTNPVVSSLLLSIGFLGLIIEFWTLGWGIAGSIGIISLSLFFGGHIIVGLAGFETIILFVIGLLLLLAEIFFIPGFGLAGISGIAAILASIFLTFGNIIQATYSILIALGISVIGFFLLIKYIPSTRTWRKFVLSTEQKKELGYTVGTKDLKRLIGGKGISITPLRPSGIVEVNGKKLDALTRGEYVDSNTKIKVISIEGNKIVVEAVDAS
ncbi:ATP-dependent Clp protease proteolytic subunit [bacterium]|nr:ATP-dependent Clp protease proteolytic subunit [bacterium]MBU1427623.1 ATP-dependent Clp protease proteolytic subunit [bacterium]